MYAEVKTAGKHLILDAKEIQNKELLNNFNEMLHMLDMLCSKYKFSVIGRNYHIFDTDSPQKYREGGKEKDGQKEGNKEVNQGNKEESNGFTILFLLEESHLSLHTFPERNYAAFDLYTCREYPDNQVYEEIHEYLCNQFDCLKESPMIVDRCFS